MSFEYTSEVRIRAKNIINRLVNKSLSNCDAEDLIVDLAIGVMNIHNSKQVPITLTEAKQEYEQAEIKLTNVLKDELFNYEKVAIIKALTIKRGNRKQACQLLNMNERTLYRKLIEYGLSKIY